MFALSFAIHLIVFVVIWYTQGFGPLRPAEEQVTYVDLMALPVASPQSGTPAPATHAAPPAPAPPAAPSEMALPAPKSKGAKAAIPKAKAEKPSQAKTEKPKAEESREFNERMAKLEQQAEERRQAAVFEKLRKGIGAGRVGMPGAKGTQAGSDYASYVNSRLQDAFRAVMVAQSKTPQLWATITIAPDGTIAEYRVDRKSGDAIFDDSVARAVTLAEKTLRPPPGGKPFKGKYRFKPEGVGVR